MRDLIFKIYFKILRFFKINITISIKNGPLKGTKWHVSIPDNRYILGNYEPEMSRLIESAITSTNRKLVDIGANAGYFSLLAGKLGDLHANHIAIEPNPKNIQLLKSHFEINNIDNVKIEALAVSNISGTIQFSDTDNLAANTYKSESSIYKEKTISVKSNTLDYLAEKYSLNEQCIIKIDVEGAELDVLKGGLVYIKEYHPHILLATHNCHVKNVEEDCLSLLDSLGYKADLIEDNKIPGQSDFYCTFQ